MNNLTSKFVVVLHGPMGSGKTTASNTLNDKLVPSARVALPDVRRMVSGDRRKNGEVARTAIIDMADSYLNQDIPVIIETVYGEGYIRQCFDLAKENNCPCLAYKIIADKAVRWERVCDRTRLMMGVEVLPEEKKTELRSFFDENDEFYSKQTGEVGQILDTSQLSPKEVIEVMVDELRKEMESY